MIIYVIKKFLLVLQEQDDLAYYVFPNFALTLG